MLNSSVRRGFVGLEARGLRRHAGRLRTRSRFTPARFKARYADSFSRMSLRSTHGGDCHRIRCVVFLSAAGWADQAHAQLGVGSTWVRTDPQGKGITLTVEACCNGGLRLIYQIPLAANQPATTVTVDSPMDGTEAPALFGGKPSGETMAIKRVDDHHYSAVVKMNGTPLGTFNGTVSSDGKTMTVDSVMQAGGQVEKIVETWVRK